MCTERLKYDLSDMMLLQLQTFVQNPGNRSGTFWELFYMIHTLSFFANLNIRYRM